MTTPAPGQRMAGDSMPGDSMTGDAMAAGTRSSWRAVGLPSEHGGWGLTLEPVLLGLLVAPSTAGLRLGVAAFVAFLVRTPLRVVAVDLRRGRRLKRTRTAAMLAGVEGILLAVLVLGALARADGPFWVPALVALPLVAVEVSYDVRSRSRRLVPELAGAAAVASVAAMIVLAGGGTSTVAAAAWLVLVARASTSIPFVRSRIATVHGRAPDATSVLAGDLSALALAAAAAVVEPAALLGAAAVATAVVLQRLAGRRPPPRAVVVGLRQTVLGLAVVALAAIGLLTGWP